MIGDGLLILLDSRDNLPDSVLYTWVWIPISVWEEDVMKRCTIALAVVMMLAASVASAGFYTSLRYAGTFNLKELAVGMQADKLGAEVAVGYSKTTLHDLDLGFLDYIGFFSDDTVDPDISIMTLGAAVFFEIAGNEDYGFDVGGRFQYSSFGFHMASPEDIEVMSDDNDISVGVSGVAFGPVLSGRWYMADGSWAIGPEIYAKYNMMSSFAEVDGEDISEDLFGDLGTTTLSLEYSLRMDFYF